MNRLKMDGKSRINNMFLACLLSVDFDITFSFKWYYGNFEAQGRSFLVTVRFRLQHSCAVLDTFQQCDHDLYFDITFFKCFFTNPAFSRFSKKFKILHSLFLGTGIFKFSKLSCFSSSLLTFLSFALFLATGFYITKHCLKCSFSLFWILINPLMELFSGLGNKKCEFSSRGVISERTK